MAKDNFDKLLYTLISSVYRKRESVYTQSVRAIDVCWHLAVHKRCHLICLVYMRSKQVYPLTESSSQTLDLKRVPIVCHWMSKCFYCQVERKGTCRWVSKSPALDSPLAPRWIKNASWVYFCCKHTEVGMGNWRGCIHQEEWGCLYPTLGRGNRKWRAQLLIYLPLTSCNYGQSSRRRCHPAGQPTNQPTNLKCMIRTSSGSIAGYWGFSRAFTIARWMFLMAMWWAVTPINLHVLIARLFL